MACAAVLAPGIANNSPYLRAMIEMLPEGGGYILADAAYGGVENCDTILNIGRGAIIDVKSNAVIKGFNARVGMLGFGEEYPGTFHRILRLLNNVESVFSSMKARFGGVVRALSEKTQSAELLSMTVCNMAFA